MPTREEAIAELERRRAAAASGAAPVAAAAPPAVSREAALAELQRRAAVQTKPAPMQPGQPNITPMGGAGEFNPEAFRGLNVIQPKALPAPNAPNPIVTAQRDSQARAGREWAAQQPERIAKEQRWKDELAAMNAAGVIPFKNNGPDGSLELNQERPDLLAGRTAGAFINSNIGVANTAAQVGLNTANAYGAGFDPAVQGAMAGNEYGDRSQQVADALTKGGYAQNAQTIRERGDIVPSLPIPAAQTAGEMGADITGNLLSVFTGWGAPVLKAGKTFSETMAAVPGLSRTLRGVGVEAGENAALAYGMGAGAAPPGSDRNMAGLGVATDPMSYLGVEALRAIPRGLKAIDGPLTPTNAGGARPGSPRADSPRPVPPTSPLQPPAEMVPNPARKQAVDAQNAKIADLQAKLEQAKASGNKEGAQILQAEIDRTRQFVTEPAMIPAQAATQGAPQPIPTSELDDVEKQTIKKWADQAFIVDLRKAIDRVPALEAAGDTHPNVMASAKYRAAEAQRALDEFNAERASRGLDPVGVPAAHQGQAPQPIPTATATAQAAGAPPIQPPPPVAAAANAAVPTPGAVPPAGRLVPIPRNEAVAAYNALPPMTREALLRTLNSGGKDVNSFWSDAWRNLTGRFRNSSEAMDAIRKLGDMPEDRQVMFALEMIKNNGGDLETILPAMGRKWAVEGAREPQLMGGTDRAREIMDANVPQIINGQGERVAGIAQDNFGPGMVPAKEAIDVEKKALASQYDKLLNPQRSQYSTGGKGQVRAPQKKAGIDEAIGKIKTYLKRPEVIDEMPEWVKMKVMQRASEDMRNIGFTDAQKSVILAGDGAVLAPLFEASGPLTWSPKMWAHLVEQYPTQAAHVLQSAYREAADGLMSSVSRTQADVTNAQYLMRLRGESGQGGLLDMLERAIPGEGGKVGGKNGYQWTRQNFGDNRSAERAFDILKRFKTAANSEGDVAAIITELKDLPARHREAAENQITSLIRQELGRKVENVKLSELDNPDRLSAPNLTTLSNQNFLNALEDVFGERGKELADGIRLARASTDTLTSISPKYDSRTQINAEDVAKAGSRYEDPAGADGGIVDNTVKTLGATAIPAVVMAPQAAPFLLAGAAGKALYNAWKAGKRLSNSERNQLVDFLFRARKAGEDALPNKINHGNVLGSALIHGAVGGTVGGLSSDGDPGAIAAGAGIGLGVGAGRQLIRSQSTLIKPPSTRGARRGPPPFGGNRVPGAGPAVMPPAPRAPLPGQTSSASPTVTGALVGGGLGYASSDGDPTATAAGALGGGALGRMAGKMGARAEPPRPTSRTIPPRNTAAAQLDPSMPPPPRERFINMPDGSSKSLGTTGPQRTVSFASPTGKQFRIDFSQDGNATAVDFRERGAQAGYKPTGTGSLAEANAVLGAVQKAIADDVSELARPRYMFTGETAAQTRIYQQMAKTTDAPKGYHWEGPDESGAVYLQRTDMAPKPTQNGFGSRSLPMDEASRMERAKAQGFDTETRWYHGTQRLDRLVGDGKLNPKRATSGPMPFFTDDPAIASKYATGKPDNSMPDMEDYSQAFTVSPKDVGHTRGRTPYTVEQTWNYLTPEQKRTISDRVLRVGYENVDQATGPLTLHPEGARAFPASEDHYNWVLKNEARGNPLTALRKVWLEGGILHGEEDQLKQIYQLAGYPHPISMTNAPWTTAEGVMPAYLRMRKPLQTDSADIGAVVEQLRQDFARDRSRKVDYGADAWDKNSRFTPREWVEQLADDLAKGENSYVWTSIPDKVTDALKRMGYDGIIDTGGKSGGPSHRVAIPFDPANIRSTNAKFDPAESGSSKLLAGLRGSAPEAIGAGAGGAIGYATAPDANGDGTVDANERAMGGAGGMFSGVVGVKGARAAMGGLGKGRMGPPSNKLAKPVEIPKPRQMGFGGEAPQERGPTFYSALERGVSRNPTAKAPAAQWKSTIQNMPGVKAEEIEWTGINDWLDTQTGPVTKQQVSDYLKQNGVKVEEVVRGDGGRDPAIQRELLPLIEERERLTRQLQQMGDEAQGTPEFNAILERRAEMNPRIAELQQKQVDHTGRKTKWSSYTLPGGENYREMLLTLPDAQPRLTTERKTLTDIANQWPAHPERDAAIARLQELNRAAPVSPKTGRTEGYKSSHWDEPNVLAHIRFKERMAGNRKVLAIEEIQSDWHQAGREKGYKTPEVQRERARLDAELKDASEALAKQDARTLKIITGYDLLKDSLASTKHAANRNAVAQFRNNDDAWVSAYNRVKKAEADIRSAQVSFSVPNAPFKDNAWARLSLKRMIRWAAENGFDEIAWVPGQVPVERFSLSSKINSIQVDPTPDGHFELDMVMTGGAKADFRVLPDGTIRNASGPAGIAQAKGQNLSDVIGKELAAKVLATTKRQSMSGLDLEVGGEGMRAFYDTILVNEANKIGKKYGARVGRTVTDAKKGYRDDGSWITWDGKPVGITYDNGRYTVAFVEDGAEINGGMTFDNKDEAIRQAQLANKMPSGSADASRANTWHSLPITPELKAKALGGMELMSAPGAGNLTTAGASGGAAAYGWANPQDANDDGVIDNTDRQMTAMGYGMGTLATAGSIRGMMGKGARPKGPPGIRSNSFGGVNANTADRTALYWAKQMEASGASREQIFDATKWFKGNDGVWAFEINDTKAKFHPAVRKQMKADGRVTLGGQNNEGAFLSDTFKHPEAQKAYPGYGFVTAKGVVAPDTQPSGSFAPSEYGTMVGRQLEANAPDLKTAREVILHEGQHGIQNIEGFAVGGSVERILSDPVFARRLKTETYALASADGHKWADLGAWAKNDYRERAAEKIYNNLIGEVAARNVVKRDAMRQRGEDPGYPWETEDVPADQQVALFDGGRADSISPPRIPRSISQEIEDKARSTLTPGEFVAWKHANAGQSNEFIARKIGGQSGGNINSVPILLSRAAKKGFDAPRAPNAVIADKTKRVIELKASGLSNQQIADRLYPGEPKGPDRVKVLLAKHRNRLVGTK